jgi:sensor histidine kinase YesM
MIQKTFRLSNKIIWLSSLLLAVISSFPKTGEQNVDLYETLINSSVTFLFSLFIWYYNIYTLPRHASRDTVKGLSIVRLAKSLVFGIAVMFVLASAQQYLLSHLSFWSVLLMIEARGVLINLMCYMFLHLLYKNYHNQLVLTEVARVKSDNMRIQYELVKQQVNPHFLVSSLNILKHLIESGDAGSVNYIAKLSDFYRYTIESRKLDLIRLTKEQEILDSYMFLLMARFGDSITISVKIDHSQNRSLIPPFTLQLLIENCLKHNDVSPARPLDIRLYSNEQFIVVENVIQHKKVEEVSSGLGLGTINQRYLHLVGKEIHVEATDNSFLVKLPLIQENQP